MNGPADGGCVGTTTCLAAWSPVDDDEQDQDDGARTAGRSGDPSAPGVEQFQRAALEAVRAARAMLDAAETMIQDPATVESVVRRAAGMARTATETVAGFAAGAGAAPDRGAHEPADDPDGDADAGGFESIRID